MKKILVVSDSHGMMKNLEKVISITKNVDMLFHLGDIQGDSSYLRSMCEYPVYLVKGNCDFTSNEKNYLTIPVENHRIFLAHGHLYEVDWSIEKLTYAALEQECDIAMYGHTHVPEIIYGDDITVVNPGSISRPRQENRCPSYLIMDIDENDKIKYTINYLKK